MGVKLNRKLRLRIGILTDVSLLIIFILNNCVISISDCQLLTQQ